MGENFPNGGAVLMCCFNTYSWLVKRITWFGRGRLNGLLDESLNKLFQWADAMGQFNGPIQWANSMG
jgi:hypothetical protein